MVNLKTINELCKLLGDSTRVRLVSALCEAELTVAELTQLTGLAQSRVSSHLAKLKEAGLVQFRRDGNSSFYASDEDSMPTEVRRFWKQLKASLEDPLLDDDLERVHPAHFFQNRANEIIF